MVIFYNLLDSLSLFHLTLTHFDIGFTSNIFFYNIIIKTITSLFSAYFIGSIFRYALANLFLISFLDILFFRTVLLEVLRKSFFNLFLIEFLKRLNSTVMFYTTRIYIGFIVGIYGLLFSNFIIEGDRGFAAKFQYWTTFSSSILILLFIVIVYFYYSERNYNDFAILMGIFIFKVIHFCVGDISNQMRGLTYGLAIYTYDLNPSSSYYFRISSYLDFSSNSTSAMVFKIFTIVVFINVLLGLYLYLRSIKAFFIELTKFFVYMFFWAILFHSLIKTRFSDFLSLLSTVGSDTYIQGRINFILEKTLGGIISLLFVLIPVRYTSHVFSILTIILFVSYCVFRPNHWIFYTLGEVFMYPGMYFIMRNYTEQTVFSYVAYNTQTITSLIFNIFSQN